jgi:hypothetical protein
VTMACAGGRFAGLAVWGIAAVVVAATPGAP